MSTPREKFSTADKIVKATLGKLGLADKRYYLQFLQFLYSFLDEYTVEDAGQIKTVQLAVQANRTADLPDDYVDWVRVGQQVGSYILNLAFNRDLSLMPDADVTFPTGATPDASPYAVQQANLSLYPFMGWSGGALAGYGAGGYRREFVVDKADRQIRLNSQLNAYPLYLEYIGSDTRNGPETMVDPRAKMAAEYYILWQYSLRKKELGPAQNYERLYYRERENIVRRSDEFTFDALYAILDDNYGHQPRL